MRNPKDSVSYSVVVRARFSTAHVSVSRWDFAHFPSIWDLKRDFLSIEILLCENLPTGCCCFIFKIEADFQKLSQKTCGLIFDGRLLFQLLDSIAVSLFVGIGWVGITH